ncbi:MAG: hypothetical protein ACFCVH_16850 [Alphaproteobacteria bacterium]
MTNCDNEAILGTLLASARHLRRLAQTATPPAPGFGFPRSTLGLASLIEAWCIDNARALLPGLAEAQPADGDVDERTLLDAIARRLRVGGCDHVIRGADRG